jgi:hypothetical protein
MSEAVDAKRGEGAAARDPLKRQNYIKRLKYGTTHLKDLHVTITL